MRGVEDARGPVGGGHTLCRFKEGTEGGDGEGVTLGECGEDAAKLGEDYGGGELEGVGVSIEAGDAAAGTVGGGGHRGSSDEGKWGMGVWREMEEMESRFIVEGWGRPR